MRHTKSYPILSPEHSLIDHIEVKQFFLRHFLLVHVVNDLHCSLSLMSEEA